VKFCVSFLFLAAVLSAQTPPAAPPGAAPQASPAAADPNKVILTIGDQKYTVAEYDAWVASLPDQYQQYAKGPGKRQFAENLVQMKLLSAEAERRKLDKDPKVVQQIEFQKENLLAGALFQNIQETTKPDDAAMMAYYNEHKNEYEKVKARHILIRVKGAPMPAAPGKPELSEDEAKAKADAIVKRLSVGEDFATVAKAESDDTGSGAQGGDLGEFGKGMMVPPFEQAAFAQKVGEVGQPVRSPFGFHIIQVQSHVIKTMADVKPEIEAKLRPELAKKTVEAMREKSKVTLDDSFFGPAQPAAPAPPKPPVQLK
jgi:parvulin-like peptidyl-prolyl isomerase